MSFRDFRKTNAVDRVVSLLQDEVGRCLDQITKKSHLDSQILESVPLFAGQPNYVEHGLGRALSCWTPVRVRAQATIWDAQDGGRDPRHILTLWTTANVVVDLMVA